MGRFLIELESHARALLSSGRYTYDAFSCQLCSIPDSCLNALWLQGRVPGQNLGRLYPGGEVVENHRYHDPRSAEAGLAVADLWIHRDMVPVYVFSRTLRQADCPGVIVTDRLAETVADLKAKPGKDIWLFGGGELFRGLLDLGLVDAVEVAIIPVLLGGGLPLLPHPAERKKLKLVEHRVYEKTGTVSLEYAAA